MDPEYKFAAVLYDYEVLALNCWYMHYEDRRRRKQVTLISFATKITSGLGAFLSPVHTKMCADRK